ncbi:MAG: hypothetical protein IRZ32_08775 [Solirubrobacteraceae bacterium]|nr:hypothetical protein [Solirubrobacteraceae bacterium]
MSGPYPLADGAVLLSHHVDALELSCAVEHVPSALGGRPECLDLHLAGYQDLARRSPRGPVASGWTWDEGPVREPVLVHPGGLRQGRRYALESPDWLVLVAAPRSVAARIVVQLRADYLLRVGPLHAYHAARAWVERHLVPMLGGLTADNQPRWGIARIDVAADVAGVHWRPADLERITTRARTRDTHHDDERCGGQPSRVHRVAREMTGMTLGRRGGPAMARVYDKTREASTDAPIREVWRQAGYEPAQHGERIWRVEVEVRSELLRELAAQDGRLPADDPDAILSEHLDELWHYLTDDWLVLRQATPVAERVERRPPESWWQALAAAQGLNAAGPRPVRDLERRPRPQLDSARLLRQATGLLASAAAASGGLSLDDALAGLATHAHGTLGAEGFAARVHDRLQRA